MKEAKPKLLRKFLLSGGSPGSAEELLRDVTVEDLIYQLASLPADRFLPSDLEYEDFLSDESLGEKYIGTLIIRCLDHILDRSHYDNIFQDQKVSVIYEGISNGCYPVRLLISVHIRKFFESGGDGEQIEDAAWRLLFDENHRVFENSARAICSITGNPCNRISFLNVERIDFLMKCCRMESSISSGCDATTLALRMFEFCAMAGKHSDACLEVLRQNGIYEEIFELYLKGDILVKLNCMEILESMLTVIAGLKFESEASRQFVGHQVEICKESSDESDSDAEFDILIPSALRFFGAVVDVPGIFSDSEKMLFAREISKIIQTTSPHKADSRFFAALASFGSLFTREMMDDKTRDRVLMVIECSTNEDTLLACFDSLFLITESPKTTKTKEFIQEASASVVKAILRFPFGAVREYGYDFLHKALEFDQVVSIIVKEEERSHFFSAAENQYKTTLAKRKLIKHLLQRINQLYACSELPLPKERIDALKLV